MSASALTVIGFILLIHSFIAIAASIAILRDSSLDFIQVIGKLLICWLLIFVGPLIILKLISEYSPETLPKVAKSGPLAYLLFAPLNPDFHNDKPPSIDGDQPLFSHRSDTWSDDIEGTCGVDGD